MAWVRIDDHFDEHEKLAQVGPLGIALWVAGLAYCNRNLTDGAIPWSVARKLLSWEYLDVPNDEGYRSRNRISVVSGRRGNDVNSEMVIDLLVYAGLWEDKGDEYLIHDYAEYQNTKEDIAALRAMRAEAGRKGGRKSAAGRNQTPKQEPKQVLDQEHEQPASNNGATGQAESNPNPNPNPNGSLNHSDPERAHARVSEPDAEEPIDWDERDRRARAANMDRFVHQRRGA